MAAAMEKHGGPTRNMEVLLTAALLSWHWHWHCFLCAAWPFQRRRNEKHGGPTRNMEVLLWQQPQSVVFCIVIASCGCCALLNEWIG